MPPTRLAGVSNSELDLRTAPLKHYRKRVIVSAEKVLPMPAPLHLNILKAPMYGRFRVGIWDEYCPSWKDSLLLLAMLEHLLYDSACSKTPSLRLSLVACFCS